MAQYWKTKGRERICKSGIRTKVEIEIDFMDTVKGATKGMKIPSKLVICETCKGTTAKPNTEVQPCSHCNAFGYTITNYGSRKQCQNCRGTGSVAKEHCEQCTGHGVLSEEAIERINIPVGVEEGQNLRISKRGHASRTGINGEAGDLIVKLKIRPHPYFSKDGQNIVSNLDVQLVDAVLGGEMSVRTIQGTQKIQIPAGTLPTDSIILNGLGFQFGGQRSVKSSQIFKINLIYPEFRPSEKAITMLEELSHYESQINQYDPTAPKARGCYYLKQGEQTSQAPSATASQEHSSQKQRGMFSSFKNWFQ